MGSWDNLEIRYCFTLPDGSQERFNLHLDPTNLELVSNKPEKLPPWTNLDFHQCSHCPLAVDTYPHCPLAANLVNIVRPFDRILSCDEVHVEVTSEERLSSQDTTAQIGISSVMGLVIATSGCPHTAFFRPMARFHLPLAGKEETIYRATSMYLLAQYFLKQIGKDADIELEGLTRIYHNIHIVNKSTAKRLRASSERDSAVNAIVLLDMYALILPHVIKKSLEEIRYLFAPFLNAGP
jgi:hypothetical protein